MDYGNKNTQTSAKPCRNNNKTPQSFITKQINRRSKNNQTSKNNHIELHETLLCW